MLQMPPDMVIRPSGVWNTRAPFHSFLQEYKAANRVYALSVLAASRVRRDLEHPTRQPFSVRKYFSPSDGGLRRDAWAWHYYRSAFSKDLMAGGAPPTPTRDQVCENLEGVIGAARRATLIRLATLFEMYTQCWTLNYLLARLETNMLWTNEERFLANALSPVHGKEQIPSVSVVFRCLPELRRALQSLPPYFSDPKTKERLVKPLSAIVTSFSAVHFWIDLRNIIVHKFGLLPRGFCLKYAEFWNAFRMAYPFLPELKAMQRVLIYHEMVQSMALAVYRSALCMSDELERLSGERRGHPWAPGRKPPQPVPIASIPRPLGLLIQGDHESSYRWANDEVFRVGAMSGADTW
jgi:hypothetical protein